MPRLMDLPAGTRFRQQELNLTGTLLKANDCRALVLIDQPQQQVEFTGPDGATRRFQARRTIETSWAPTVVVEALSISRPAERDPMTTTKKTTQKSAAAAQSKGTRTTAPKTPAAKKTAAKTETSGNKKLSILDAAAKVLGEASEPMTTKAMIEAMAAQGYWSSPNGQTPAQTLYSAILRELQKKGPEARFQKVDRGQFKLAGR